MGSFPKKAMIKSTTDGGCGSTVYLVDLSGVASFSEGICGRSTTEWIPDGGTEPMNRELRLEKNVFFKHWKTTVKC